MSVEAYLAELRRTLPGALQESDGRALLLPRGTLEVATAVRLARSFRAPLVLPGASRERPGVPIDLRRMSDLLAFDGTSRIVHAQAGISVAVLELELRKRELTLGLVPPLPEAPLGVWLVEGAPGRRPHTADPVDQLISGLEMVLPDGSEVSIRPAPRRAVGPDLVSAMPCARGRLGIVTSAHLVLRTRWPSTELAFFFPDRPRAEAALAWICGRGVRPASMAVVEAPEGAALRLRIEGSDRLADASMAVVRRTSSEFSGVEIAVDEAPSLRPPKAPLASPLALELASRLDPDGVFG